MRVFGLVCILGLCACQRATEPQSPAQERAPEAPSLAAEPLLEAGVERQQQAMAAGEIDGERLTRAYLARIAAIDDAGPRLNAVIELNPAALDEARAMDAERRAGHLRGPLHGIPVLLKDNIDATPMVNSAGSLALADNHPADDAFLVQRLRAAGAVILGKTNLSEWANFRSTRSTSGWSGRGGQTRNPYVLDRNPCGSSSGTGAAISASLASVGIGTETDGSVICPAAVNGLVGLKPTVGLVSRDGIIPISASQDTAGPMTRSVADAAALLTAIAGSDPSDPATAQADAQSTDYRRFVDADGLRGARIGVLRERMGFHPDADRIVEHAIERMRAAGAEVIDARIPTQGEWDDAEFQVLLTEFKDGLDRYLANSPAAVHSLAELIAYNDAHQDSEMPWFGQELFQQAQASAGLDDPAYREARAKAHRLAGPEGIDAALAAGHLDALLAPATAPAWTTDPVSGDHFLGAGYGAAAVAGYPSITVPAGDVHGLPVGVVFIGPAFSEPRLIRYAAGFEAQVKARISPQFRPSL